MAFRYLTCFHYYCIQTRMGLKYFDHEFDADVFLEHRKAIQILITHCEYAEYALRSIPKNESHYPEWPESHGAQINAQFALLLDEILEVPDHLNEHLKTGKGEITSLVLEFAFPNHQLFSIDFESLINELNY